MSFTNLPRIIPVIQTSPELKSFSEANRIMITKENKHSIQTRQMTNLTYEYRWKKILAKGIQQ